ncbi:PDZ domain-containing protein [Paenibacillaceae bacterium]|nr:PDZ domain-containing protein [Paenibacillaceae bacterium]
MARWQRGYGYGMAVAIVLSVLGELVWLPDPLRIGGTFYWIDMLDIIMLLLLLTPFLWSWSALRGIVETRSQRNRAAGRSRFYTGQRGACFFSEVLLRLFIIMLAAASAVVLIRITAWKDLSLPLLISFGGLLLGCWLLAVLDIALTERRQGSRWPWRGISGLIVSVSAAAFLFWPTSNLVTYPGLTVNMNHYATVEGGEVRGEISGVLVFDRPAFPADWLYARLFPNYTFRPIERLGMSLGSYESLVRNMKAEADELGSAVAFHTAGIGQGATSHGAQVLNVEINGPAYRVLRPGDVIIGVNGQEVSSTLTLTDRMRKVTQGEEVLMTIRRGSSELEVAIKTVQHPEDAARPAVGIQVTDDLRLDLPRHVSFRSYVAHEGGPSHGAVLALTLVDQLTPGGVTYGNKVVATGTIQADGTVGRIGGIRQKAFTAYRAGADVFFVPESQYADARLGSTRLNIVPVNTIDDMLAWLKQHPKQASEESGQSR